MDYEELFLTAAIAASVALGAPPARAAESPGLELRVREIAECGPDALRQFVHRTRMIYALDFRDYALDWDAAVDGLAPDGFWAGVPAAEVDPGAWIEDAGFPADIVMAGRG